MSYLTYRKWTAVIGGIIGAVVGVSVGLDSWIAPIVVIITGGMFLAFLRRRVTDIVADERTYAIAYKAARLTVSVVGISMAVIGAILLVLARHDLSSTSAQVGFALEYATCGLLVINYLAYYYYSHKLGGR